MTKTYTLELTSEEVDRIEEKGLDKSDVELRQKISAIRTAARLDRERDDLRLPWRAIDNGSGGVPWAVRRCGDGENCYTMLNGPAAKLMSAAPELLEAVQAVRRWAKMVEGGTILEAEYRLQCKPLLERALRKVETGTPE